MIELLSIFFYVESKFWVNVQCLWCSNLGMNSSTTKFMWYFVCIHTPIVACHNIAYGVNKILWVNGKSRQNFRKKNISRICVLEF